MILSVVSTASSAAVVHDRDPLGDAGDDVDVVLDHEHRLAFLGLDGADHLDQPRISSTLTPAIGSSRSTISGSAASTMASSSFRLSPWESDPASGPPRAEPDAIESPACPVDRLADARRQPPDPHRAAEPRLGSETDVLERGQPRKTLGDLERPSQSGLGAPVGRVIGDVRPAISIVPCVGR